MRVPEQVRQLVYSKCKVLLRAVPRESKDRICQHIVSLFSSLSKPDPMAEANKRRLEFLEKEYARLRSVTRVQTIKLYSLTHRCTEKEAEEKIYGKGD